MGPIYLVHFRHYYEAFTVQYTTAKRRKGKRNTYTNHEHKDTTHKKNEGARIFTEPHARRGKISYRYAQTTPNTLSAGAAHRPILHTRDSCDS